MFTSKAKDATYVGIYLVYDPAVPDTAAKFSPPFFSPSDDVASQALLETLRRHVTSFESLMKSPFLRMDLWRVGSVELNHGSVVTGRKHRYRVCNVQSLLDRDYVKHYMMSVPYPKKEEVVQ